jgi:hypothetical protein
MPIYKGYAMLTSEYLGGGGGRRAVFVRVFRLELRVYFCMICALSVDTGSELLCCICC